MEEDTGITFLKFVDQKNGQSKKYTAHNNEDANKLI